MFGDQTQQTSSNDLTFGTAPASQPATTDTPATSTPEPQSTDHSPADTAEGYNINDLIGPDAPANSPDTGSSPADEELMNIKQDALQLLNPLVSHLEQSPEEKFKTIMMMIQASDDQTKLKEAYDTAKLIEDDKTKAQALLDVINEINYFTHQEPHNSK